MRGANNEVGQPEPDSAARLDPTREYERRHDRLLGQIRQLARAEGRISLARGLAFLAIGATIWATARADLWWGWPVLATGGFVFLVVLHHGLTRQRDGLERLAEYYLHGRERLAFDWKSGDPGTRHRDDNHPYASDLDLFGEGSVFQLLCQARTRAGQDCLAGWLKAPATLEVCRLRQAAVRELRDRLELREQLALLAGPGGVEGLDLERLQRWCERSVPALSTAPHYLAAAVTSAVIAAAFAPALGLPSGPLLVIGVAGTLALLAWSFRRVAPSLAGIEGRARDLEVVARTLRVFETESFTAPHLVALQQRLRVRGATPSAAVARLGRLLGLFELQYNQLFLPIALMVLWPVHLGLALGRWRQAHGGAVLAWLETLGELEALVSLATYAFEQADTTFPELVDGPARGGSIDGRGLPPTVSAAEWRGGSIDAGPVFDAEALGHPLLAPAARVCNDLAFGHEPQIFVVSGSNMSGKSTLLRTVGVNTVLALAGAPVCARRLRVSRVQLAATLHIQDSLLAGRSRFFAEILKLRQILDLTQAELPVLFLIDEIFHGTNSHDRQVGGTAFVRRGLLERGVIGLLSTHDQAFAALGESLAPRIQNVHFADFIEAGVMKFDYRLRSGAVQHSNALELMRSVGIDV